MGGCNRSTTGLPSSRRGVKEKNNCGRLSLSLQVPIERTCQQKLNMLTCTKEINGRIRAQSFNVTVYFHYVSYRFFKSLNAFLMMSSAHTSFLHQLVLQIKEKLILQQTKEVMICYAALRCCCNCVTDQWHDLIDNLSLSLSLLTLIFRVTSIIFRFISISDVYKK